MADIMGLRQQILENVELLRVAAPGPWETERFHFWLKCSLENEPEWWTVDLGCSRFDAFGAIISYMTIGYGAGETPELAYRDLLRHTARELTRQGY
ncbi:hypothetical protein KCU73_g9310, partial [Aureobasidium melanogenum]